MNQRVAKVVEQHRSYWRVKELERPETLRKSKNHPQPVWFKAFDPHGRSGSERNVSANSNPRPVGYRIIRWYIDSGISGDATERRLEFLKMHKAATNGRDFDVILCWDYSRFGRFDSIEAGRWIHPLRQAGVKLVNRSFHKVPRRLKSCIFVLGPSESWGPLHFLTK